MQALRKEFDSLLSTMFEQGSGLDKEDIKRLKQTAFGPQVRAGREGPSGGRFRGSNKLAGNAAKATKPLDSAILLECTHLHASWLCWDLRKQSPVFI